ncbi:hypothetical protein PIB30_081884 [Stylosanthes scabra]|uniref:Uncharacterized protein n=1 Tax=Stylosanthes scabra TaxID=79078 RepID=A0ABU6SU03_9FABA|nr:hypothetical protein [Stylosanthes scabra]
MSLFNDVHQGLSKQVMEETYSYDQGYTSWNPPPYQHHAHPPLYPPSQGNFEDILQVLLQERKELWEAQKRIDNQVTTLTLSAICLVTQFTNGREDALLNEEDVESLNECLEEVEEENEAPKAEDVDQEVDKEPKKMEIVYSISSKATSSKLPSELQFEWEEEPAELDSEFNAFGGYLHKLHNNRAKVGALSSRKHLGPWQFQEKLVD